MCVVFTYTVYKCSSVAVAEKTPQVLSLLTHSSEAEAAPGRRRFLWSQSQLASAVWWSWSARAGGQREALSKGQRVTDRHTGTSTGAWSSPQREGGPGWVLSVPFWRKRTFHQSEIKKCRTLPAVMDITWSWRWSGFEVPNFCVSPWHAMLENSCFSLSDSSYLTDAWQTYPKCALLAGWWWFFPKWTIEQFRSFGCSGSAHQGKLNV